MKEPSIRRRALLWVHSKSSRLKAAKVENQTANENVTNPKFEIYNDKAGQFRFRLRASNGEEILASEGGIGSVRKNAPSAKAVE